LTYFTFKDHCPSLIPTKCIIFRPDGGVRSRKHIPFINLAQCDQQLLRNDPDLQLTQSILSQLPLTCSAVIASPNDTSTVLQYLITEKMPPQRPATLIRRGIDVHVHRDLHSIDFKRLQSLLESSFGKPLSFPSYLERFQEASNLQIGWQSSIHAIILAGDYQGVAIVSKESLDTSDSFLYLDKFAISPNAQGTGIVDILWDALRSCCAEELVWRSRAENGVNRW
jgi:amino-acid N-acetyltransferase